MQAKITLPIYDEELSRDLLARLNRVVGQVQGVSRMVESGRPCLEVLQQLASAQAAMRSASKIVLRNYLERCATDAIRSGDSTVYDNLMDAIYKFAK